MPMAATRTGTAARAPALPVLKAELLARAHALGFDAVNVAAPGAIPHAGERLMTFLAEGRHGDMDWMQATADRRSDPRALWPDAASIVMLGVSYAPDSDPMRGLAQKSHGVISVYAQGKDYHDVVKARLKTLARWLHAASGQDVKVFIDTAPLMEKPLAQAAGLGWQGKHTNLVSRQHGSWLFLGAIACVAPLPPDEPERDHCGSCRRCLDVCPTAAFPAPYQLDARRCIAYLTIEHKGHIPPEFRAPIGNRVFGCDDCLAVCPWNKFAAASREAKFAAVAGATLPGLAELLALDEDGFRARFRGTPVKRTGRDRFLRNVLIAAGNSGDHDLIDAVTSHLAARSPLVRAMAAWALQRLLNEPEIARYRQAALAAETDADVIAEWTAATVPAIREAPCA
jgi:epoxyqueuosine reductase